ncbi:HDOD domain-containing protein [bacterium]|nr:HDOD domain-containing protein [bacterium]
MSVSIDELVNQVGNLPPLPQAAQKALALIRDPKSSMSSISDVLGKDQVLTSLILRMANSVYYGLTFPVTTVHQATVVLGQSTIQSIILAASVAPYLERPIPGYGLDRGELWRHSIGVAAGARIVAEPFGHEAAETAYHAGLLCDIGKLAFEFLLRKEHQKFSNWKNMSFEDLENKLFGINHAELGAEIGRRWRLADPLIAAIQFHHTPKLAGEYGLIASAVHLADSAMMMMGIGIGIDGLQYSLDGYALEVLNFNQHKMDNLITKISEYVNEAEVFIGIK